MNHIRFYAKRRKNCFIYMVMVTVLLLSCGSSGGGDNNTETTLTLSFARVASAGLDPFVVTIYLAEQGQPVTGAGLDITVGKPAPGASPVVSSLTEVGGGYYSFTVTPDQTGEYPVSVRYGTVVTTRTPLVLTDVASDWEQPMSVPGYANTAGYEDGVTISPDGAYLFVQTGPIYFSAMLQLALDCGGDRSVEPCASSSWVNTTIGSYASPERTGFFTGRIDTASNALRHNSNIYQFSDGTMPVFAAITMFYGFKRQPDGSFKEPFYIAFDDLNDAIINPFGMSLKMNNDGTATLIYALQDSVTNGFDVYTRDIVLGTNNNLGTYTTGINPGDPPLRDGANFTSVAVALGDTDGTQGNPHLFTLPDGTIHSIWTDDEYDTSGDVYADYHDISVYVLDSGTFPSGSWSRFILPSPVNDANEQIQPFFTGDTLYYTQDTEIYTSGYSGASYSQANLSNSSNWGTPAKILAKDTAYDLGKIIAVGEPTVAANNGDEYLYFVYGYVREKNQAYSDAGYIMTVDINMQAGYIKKK